MLNGYSKSSNVVSARVLQGSILVLCSLLRMFINDLWLTVDSPVYMFADDTKIIHVFRSCADFFMLHNDLDTLFNWSKLWQLNFNAN